MVGTVVVVKGMIAMIGQIIFSAMVGRIMVVNMIFFVHEQNKREYQKYKDCVKEHSLWDLDVKSFLGMETSS